MSNQLHQLYINSPISQLKLTLVAQLDQAHQVQLDRLLDLVVLKSLAHVLNTSNRQQAIRLLRADPVRLVAWLDQSVPLSRIAIIEALTRVLLSLTVD